MFFAKSQSRTSNICNRSRFGSEEGIKNVRNVVLVDTHPPVGNADLNFVFHLIGFCRPPFDAYPNSNPSFVSAVFQRIGDQVLQTLRKRKQVARHLWEVFRQIFLQAKASGIDEIGRPGQRGIDDFGHLPRPRAIALPLVARGGKQQNLL